MKTITDSNSKTRQVYKTTTKDSKFIETLIVDYNSRGNKTLELKHKKGLVHLAKELGYDQKFLSGKYETGITINTQWSSNYSRHATETGYRIEKGGYGNGNHGWTKINLNKVYTEKRLKEMLSDLSWSFIRNMEGKKKAEIEEVIKEQVSSIINAKLSTVGYTNSQINKDYEEAKKSNSELKKLIKEKHASSLHYEVCNKAHQEFRDSDKCPSNFWGLTPEEQKKFKTYNNLLAAQEIDNRLRNKIEKVKRTIREEIRDNNLSKTIFTEPSIHVEYGCEKIYNDDKELIGLENIQGYINFLVNRTVIEDGGSYFETKIGNENIQVVKVPFFIQDDHLTCESVKIKNNTRTKYRRYGKEETTFVDVSINELMSCKDSKFEELVNKLREQRNSLNNIDNKIKELFIDDKNNGEMFDVNINMF